MNTPNKLTVLRLILVPFYVFFLLVPSIPHHYMIAILLFAAASYTDHLDGKLARKYNMITDFGKFADPLADKIMILSALACFLQMGLTNAIVLIIVISREFIVTSIRLVASSQGKVVAANQWGKAKTISQIAAVIVVMLLQYILELHQLKYIILDDADMCQFWFNITGDIFLWISVILTLVSGVIYLVDNFTFIWSAK